MNDSSGVDLSTPRGFDGPTAPLSRPTDHAHRAVRTAGTLLAALAVVVAVPVGVIAALSDGGGAGAGVMAGITTLVSCWTLLGLGVTSWRRHLALVDRQRWADEWARVEPRWSGRY